VLAVCRNTTLSGAVILSRGAVANANLFGSFAEVLSYANSSAITIAAPSYVFGYDAPNTTAQLTYAVQGKVSPGGVGAPTMTYGGGSQLAAREIAA
jgi:hypothetical protein